CRTAFPGLCAGMFADAPTANSMTTGCQSGRGATTRRPAPSSRTPGDLLRQLADRGVVRGQQAVAGGVAAGLAAGLDLLAALFHLLDQRPARLDVKDAAAGDVDVHRRRVGEELLGQLVLRVGVDACREPGRAVDRHLALDAGLVVVAHL